MTKKSQNLFGAKKGVSAYAVWGHVVWQIHRLRGEQLICFPVSHVYFFVEEGQSL